MIQQSLQNHFSQVFLIVVHGFHLKIVEVIFTPKSLHSEGTADILDQTIWSTTVCQASGSTQKKLQPPFKARKAEHCLMEADA